MAPSRRMSLNPKKSRDHSHGPSRRAPRNSNALLLGDPTHGPRPPRKPHQRQFKSRRHPLRSSGRIDLAWRSPRLYFQSLSSHPPPLQRYAQRVRGYRVDLQALCRRFALLASSADKLAWRMPMIAVVLPAQRRSFERTIRRSIPRSLRRESRWYPLRSSDASHRRL